MHRNDRIIHARYFLPEIGEIATSVRSMGANTGGGCGGGDDSSRTSWLAEPGDITRDGAGCQVTPVLMSSA